MVERAWNAREGRCAMVRYLPSGRRGRPLTYATRGLRLGLRLGRREREDFLDFLVRLLDL